MAGPAANTAKTIKPNMTLETVLMSYPPFLMKMFRDAPVLFIKIEQYMENRGSYKP
jgi:hypothetical protein